MYYYSSVTTIITILIREYPKNVMLPGYAFRINQHKTHYPRVQKFQKINNIPSLVEHPVASDDATSCFLKYKSVSIPAWVAIGKNVLCFDAYYKQSISYSEPPFQVRLCKVFFFLEDGTMKIVEKPENNSGILQGTLVARQRVPFPAPNDEQFYDMSHLNIGKELEVYGRKLFLTNCDKFTRTYLNRLGIFVPDPITPPEDPVMAKRNQKMIFSKKPYVKRENYLDRVKYDRKVLTFVGYWDDTESELGWVHQIKLRYFLVDDTMEVQCVEPESGKYKPLVRRCKMPKIFVPQLPGFTEKQNVLNLCKARENTYTTIYDRVRTGGDPTEYYKAQDLLIGAHVNIMGRRVVLSGWDDFTKKYYMDHYGVDPLEPLKIPGTENSVEFVPLRQRKLPPWNGFGSYEDSAQNCITVEPKQIMRDVKKFYTLDKDGWESHVLRFEARIVTHGEVDNTRSFIISYYLVDDTMTIQEKIPNTCTCSMFMAKQKVVYPGEEIYASEPPRYYASSDLYIGATLDIFGFIFTLVDADEYAFRYMELHPEQFPKSNIKLILDKVRERLRPTFKEFIAKNIEEKSQTMSFCKLEKQITPIMGDDWTKHEMITLARHYSIAPDKNIFTRDYVRQLVLTQVRRMLWNQLERLKEYFVQRDDDKSGYLPMRDIYNMVTASRVPVSKELLNHLLNVVKKNDKGYVDYEDLCWFLDESTEKVPAALLVSVAHNPCDVSSTIPRTASVVNWCRLTEDLNLDDVFNDTQQPSE